MDAMVYVALFAVGFVVPIVIDRFGYRRRMARNRADRDARWAREDAAWDAWCRSASRAIGTGEDVPTWKESS